MVLFEYKKTSNKFWKSKDIFEISISSLCSYCPCLRVKRSPICCSELSSVLVYEPNRPATVRSKPIFSLPNAFWLSTVNLKVWKHKLRWPGCMRIVAMAMVTLVELWRFGKSWSKTEVEACWGLKPKWNREIWRVRN